MKTNYIIILIFTALFFTNCNDSPHDVKPPYLYKYHLKFIDENNNNLLEDIKHINLLKSNFILDAPAANNYVGGADTITFDNELFLEVVASTPPDDRTEVINFKIINNEIFNDEEVHHIVTYWEVGTKGKNIPIKVTLDGKPLEEGINSSFKYFIVEL